MMWGGRDSALANLSIFVATGTGRAIEIGKGVTTTGDEGIFFSEVFLEGCESRTWKNLSITSGVACARVRIWITGAWEPRDTWSMRRLEIGLIRRNFNGFFAKSRTVGGDPTRLGGTLCEVFWESLESSDVSLSLIVCNNKSGTVERKSFALSWRIRVLLSDDSASLDVNEDKTRLWN